MPNLTDTKRQAIVQDILSRSTAGRVPHGTYAELARANNVHWHTVERIWKRYVENAAQGIVGGAPESRIKGRSGRKPYDRAELAEKISAIPKAERRRVSTTAARVGVSPSLMRSLLAEGHLARRSGRIKPLLSDEQKLKRMKHAISFIDETTGEFEGMFNMVHIDEKWFNEDVDHRSYLLLPDEEAPARHRRSKRFISKTMFLAAVARPRYDHKRKTMFDGKLGIWPLVEKYTAQRSSANRPRGTVLVRNIASIDREVIKSFLLEAVIPAIKTKWPARDRRMAILIQQDNAKPHVSAHDPDIVAAGTADGWNIRLFSQPANSPDLNVLDLGFFASIQSIQIERPIYSIDELIGAVVDAYESVHYTAIDDIFLTLQNVMICILQSRGGNEYTLPHMGKQHLRRIGALPTVLSCPRDVFQTALAAVGGDCIVELNTCEI